VPPRAVPTQNAPDKGRATLTPAQVDRFRVDTLALTGAVSGRIGLAVSGGGDSLAMLLLANAAFPGQVEVATVDHRLRPAAADEAAFVAALCLQRGIAHATLAVEVPSQANVSDAARQVRYAALYAWREKRGLDWIATAHHADDQLETFVMRLNRASGLSGLAGIRAINGSVVRPLLGWRRSDLAKIVNAAGIEPVADPTNIDDRYDRARLRKQLALCDLLDASTVARSAALLGEAEAALDAAIDILADRISCGEDWATFDPARLTPELRRRLLGRCLAHVDPGSVPRGSAVARATAALDEGRRVSIGNALVQVAQVPGGGIIWRVGKAPARRTQ
jgi:tRNA(Ile)-lysidine synthase